MVQIFWPEFLNYIQGGRQMMKVSVLRVGVLMLAVGFSACTSLPEATRTAAIHDINVEMELSPENLSITPGDEVRWVNLRKEPITVEIANLNIEDLSCQKGFTNWLGQLQESGDAQPNETASLCFKKTGFVQYNVRAETALGGGSRVFPGM
jgi:plastocyanin